MNLEVNNKKWGLWQLNLDMPLEKPSLSCWYKKKNLNCWGNRLVTKAVLAGSQRKGEAEIKYGRNAA